MSNAIDPERVRQIARLARLNLSLVEAELFAGQLGHILDYFRQLETVDTRHVEPLAHPLTLTNVLRDDEPRPSLLQIDALAAAPQRERDFFRVPAVLDPASGA